MIVIIGGMHRSGSTFSFNIVRELLASRGGVAVAAVNSLQEAIQENSDCANIVIKTHTPDSQVTALIRNETLPCICTFRTPEDAVVSWMKVFGFSLSESVCTVRGWLQWHREISPHVLNIRYETIDRYPWWAIIKIQKYLTGNINLAETVRLWRKYRKGRLKLIYDRLDESPDTTNIGFTYYDKQSFFHRRHISSRISHTAQEELTSEQIAFVRSELKGLVDPFGKYCP